MNVERCCRDCNKDTVFELRQTRTRAGASSYGWQCTECNQWQAQLDKTGFGVWIAKEKLLRRGIDLDSLPMVANPHQERCIRCGSRGAELHHWGPCSIFKEAAESWPKDYLCKPCHEEWHKMVTPQLVYTEPF